MWGTGCDVSGGFGLASVVFHPGDVDDDHGFIADNPGVVTGWDVDGFAGADVAFGAIVHPEVHGSGELDSEMGGLAARGTGDGFDVGGPAPSGLEGCAAEGDAANGDEFDFAVWELASFLWSGETQGFE